MVRMLGEGMALARWRDVAFEVGLLCLGGTVAAARMSWWATPGWQALALLAVAEGIVAAYLLWWTRRQLHELRLEDGTPLTSLGPANMLTILRRVLVPPLALPLLLAGSERGPQARRAARCALRRSRRRR